MKKTKELWYRTKLLVEVTVDHQFEDASFGIVEMLLNKPCIRNVELKDVMGQERWEHPGNGKIDTSKRKI